jgi:chaperonin GroES
MCCLCFTRVEQDQLHVLPSGLKEDVCLRCSEKEESARQGRTKTTMKTKLKPLGNRVLIERDEIKTETPSGILLPDQAREKPREGTVIAVGWKQEEADKHSVKPGDRVMLPKFGGVEVENSGLNKQTLIDEDEIMGILVPVEDSAADDDLDTPLPPPQACTDETCESCQ